jgi:hypothetical protein
MTADKDRRAQALNDLTRTQRERLSHIDFKLYFLGELRRADVVDRFGTGPAGATRDIALYRQIAPENLELDGSDKVYRPTQTFSPLFEHSAQQVLTALTQGYGEGLNEQVSPMLRCEIPNSLSLPSTAVLAPITRAINRGKAVKLGYTSVDSGYTERELVPVALVDIGIRWHVRAFDRWLSQRCWRTASFSERRPLNSTCSGVASSSLSSSRTRNTRVRRWS